VIPRVLGESLRVWNPSEVPSSGTSYASPDSAAGEWAWVRQIAVFRGIQITEGLLQKRFRALWVVNIEAGRMVACVNFEERRAIK
jgi:hypothetical protein